VSAATVVEQGSGAQVIDPAQRLVTLRATRSGGPTDRTVDAGQFQLALQALVDVLAFALRLGQVGQQREPCGYYRTLHNSDVQRIGYVAAVLRRWGTATA
jgi:hypothetical protein